MNFGASLLGTFKVPPRLIGNTLENGKACLGKMVTVLGRNVIVEGGLNFGMLKLAEQIPLC